MTIYDRDWYKGSHPPNCTCVRCTGEDRSVIRHPSDCTCELCWTKRNEALYSPKNRKKAKPKTHLMLNIRRHLLRNTLFLILFITLICVGLSYAGIEPLTTYKNNTINYLQPGIEKIFLSAKQVVDNVFEDGTSEESIQKRVQELYELTNNERVKNGLQPLTRNAALEKLAQGHSIDMYDRNNVDHLGFYQRSDAAFSVGFLTTAENCAGGGFSASSFIDMWMDSPGHRENITNPALTHVGIGIYEKYAVQFFGGY